MDRITTRKITTLSMLVLGLIVVVLGVRNKGETHRLKKVPESIPEAVTFSDQVHSSSGEESPLKASDEGLKSRNVDTRNKLLTELEITGDADFLRQAQSLFPNDPDIVILSALWAESADSEWLDKLEALQPDNSLPNFIRASFHAEQSDVAQFVEEMKVALSKPGFNTSFKERLSRMLDSMIESGTFPKHIFGSGNMVALDGKFAARTSPISRAFTEDRVLSGNSEEMDSMGLAWASKLQSMPTLDLMYRTKGLFVESEILSRYSKDDLYGNSDTTVAERLKIVEGEINLNHSKIGRYFTLIAGRASNSGSDRILKQQFIARVYADGELSAVNWLMTQ